MEKFDSPRFFSARMNSPLSQIDDWPVPHAAVAVIGPGGIVAQHGAHDHEFRLASISKVMMGYATLIAVEEGSVKLDDVVEPGGDLEHRGSVERNGANGPVPVSLRHLLSHAAGFGFDSGSKQVSAPETRRIYSNEGIERAARYVEQQTGMPFVDYLREALFEPLGMASTELRGSPASHVHSNLVDMSHFASELLRPTLLAPETFADFTSCQFPTLAGILPGIGRFDPLPWGLGVEIKGHKQPHWSGRLTSPSTFGHFGGTGTFLWVDPTRKLAAIALANREFDAWAMAVWPQFNDAIVTTFSVN
jgi:CubicO group peptidase (beta-lactamase class C family)